MNTTLARKMLSTIFIGSLAVGMLSGFLLPETNPGMQSGDYPLSIIQQNTTSTPTPTDSTPTRYFMQFDEISFYYISTVATKVTGRTVEKSLDVNNPITPAMDQFEFQNYAVSSQIKPRITVFSAQDFMDMGGDSAIKQVEKLKLLNVSQQANPPGDLPMLLGEPATQLIRAGLQYVKFQNGSGIRYITQYGEQPWPFDNNLLFYTFQGLTNDGAFYISAVLPVNHAEIAGDDGFAQIKENAAKFQSNYPAYVDYMEKQLNAEQPESYAPNLASLDAMIKSMTIEKKSAVRKTSTSTSTIPQPTVTITNSPSGCSNQAAFVADVTIPDETILEPGASFVKTWRLKNTGNCTWTSDFKLVFLSGDAMGALASAKLTNASVPPNANLNVTVALKAPETPGNYQGYFKMRAPDGSVFGIEPNGINPFWVLIHVAAPDTPTFTPTKTPVKIVPPLKPKLTAVLPPKLVPVQP
jgi:hypothetical protein